MFKDLCLTEEITDFRKLGTGHKRTKIFVVDLQRDRILFNTSVFQNRPLTTGKVRFRNGRSFDLSSRTVGNQKAALFLWTETLERRWLRQCMIEKIHDWLESAKREDAVVFAELVPEKSGWPKFKHHPDWVMLAIQDIKAQLLELGFLQIQELTAMLFSVPETIAA